MSAKSAARRLFANRSRELQREASHSPTLSAQGLLELDQARMQIVQMNATLSEILNLCAITAMEAIEEKQGKVTPIAKGKKAKA